MASRGIAAHPARLVVVAVATAVALLWGLVGTAGASAPPLADSSTAGPASTTDVPPGHGFAEEIGWLLDRGIAEGYPDGRFGPTGTISRQAAAAFLARAGSGADALAACDEAPFPDVAVDHPFCPEISWAHGAGLVDGYDDGSFGPGRVVTRQAAAAYLARLEVEGELPACVEAPFPDLAIDHQFCAEIAWISSAGIALGYGDGGFGPGRIVSRQAIAAFFYRAALLADEGLPEPTAGCGTSTAEPGQNIRVDLDVAGEERWFLHTVPEAHDGTTPLALVLDFHGLSEGATIHVSMSQYNDVAEDEGFVVAYPHGRFSPVRWDADPLSDPNADLLFVDAIIDTLGEELCLDASRTYATGLSYGAMMTSLLTCTRSDRFAAVAPVAGAALAEPCPQGRSVPIVAFHGTDDEILPFEGGIGDVPVGGADSDDVPEAASSLDRGYEATMQLWAQRNGCRPEPVDHQLTDEVIRRVWDCPVGAAVEFYIIVGGGHTWPGSDFSKIFPEIMGHTTEDIHASEVSWAFFERFFLP